MANYSLYDQVIKDRTVLRETSYSHWVNDELFTWRWWLQIALIIVPWFIWWRIVDKNRTQEILLYGFAVSIITLIIDAVGTKLIWWGYPNELFYHVEFLEVPDVTLVPIYLMIVYQYFSKDSRTFLIANIIAGAAVAFIAEPIFIWLKYYVMYTWKSVYSWMFYIVVSVISRWIVIKTGTFHSKQDT